MVCINRRERSWKNFWIVTSNVKRNSNNKAEKLSIETCKIGVKVIKLTSWFNHFYMANRWTLDNEFSYTWNYSHFAILADITKLWFQWLCIGDVWLWYRAVKLITIDISVIESKNLRITWLWHTSFNHQVIAPLCLQFF